MILWTLSTTPIWDIFFVLVFGSFIIFISPSIKNTVAAPGLLTKCYIFSARGHFLFTVFVLTKEGCRTQTGKQLYRRCISKLSTGTSLKLAPLALATWSEYCDQKLMHAHLQQSITPILAQVKMMVKNINSWLMNSEWLWSGTTHRAFKAFTTYSILCG